MIGRGIRKYAAEHGMVCDKGFAYGKVNGRHIAMYEGEGYKALCIYLHPPVEDGEEYAGRSEQILQALTDCDLKEFRLHRAGAVTVNAGYARLVFFDTMGTMKLIVRYIDEIMPKLDALDLDTERCACCGRAFDGEVKHALLDGSIMPVHAECMQQLSALVESVENEPREGSVIRGGLGALLGALCGAVLYALCFALGYISGLMGLVVGVFSSRFYDKFGGKQTHWKLVVIAVMLILGVVLGQVAGYTAEFWTWYDEVGYAEDEYSRAYYIADCWEMYMLLDQESAMRNQFERLMADVSPEARESGMYMTADEYVKMYYSREVDELRVEMQDEFNRNLAMGLFLGALGSLTEFMRVYNRTRKRKVQELK